MTTTAAAPAKPDYLDLLNLISLAESHAGVYLKAWAEVTPSPELRDAIAFVAGRESSHGNVFCQLIERLGFCLEETEDPKFAEQTRIYGDPGISDAEKIRYGRASLENIDPRFFTIDARINDESVDALTRDTLRWYIHEERDSGELLTAAYARMGIAMDGAQNGQASVSADAKAIMDCMSQGFGSLQQSLKELAEGLGRTAKSKPA